MTITDAIRSFSTLSISTVSSQTSSVSPGSGMRPGLAHDELADRDVVGGPRPFDPDARALERQIAGEPHASVGQAQRQQARRLELVGHAAEQLAEHVLERDHAGDFAGRVDDERLVAAPLAQEAEQAIGRPSSRARAGSA